MKSDVQVARKGSEKRYHHDTFEYAKQDMKNMGAKNGALTEKQVEHIYGDKDTGKKMFNTLDTNHDRKLAPREVQAYVEFQDDPSILKGTGSGADKYLGGVQAKRDGVATSAERTAADTLILGDSAASSEALKQLKERAETHSS
jgi:hypothetical protein